jgi:hypothetical protein
MALPVGQLREVHLPQQLLLDVLALALGELAEVLDLLGDVLHHRRHGEFPPVHEPPGLRQAGGDGLGDPIAQPLALAHMPEREAPLVLSDSQAVGAF